MSSYRELLTLGRQELQNAGITEYAIDARYLLEHVIQRDRSWYFLHMEEPADAAETAQYEKLIQKRSLHIPLQQLTGFAYFMGHAFKVDRNVLIPRQDTEILVEEAMKRMKPGADILDMCTGSGCILLSLLYNGNKENGYKVSGTGADISEKALEIARENSRLMGLDARFVHSNLFAAVEGSFDLIVSNPPYIPAEIIPGLMAEVRDYEPRLALDGGKDGLDFYREIVCRCQSFLKDGGWLIFEIGQEQGSYVSGMMQDAGLREIEVVQDLAGLDRVVIGRKYQEEVNV